jgi:hypothetical protein
LTGCGRILSMTKERNHIDIALNAFKYPGKGLEAFREYDLRDKHVLENLIDQGRIPLFSEEEIIFSNWLRNLILDDLLVTNRAEYFKTRMAIYVPPEDYQQGDKIAYLGDEPRYISPTGEHRGLPRREQYSLREGIKIKKMTMEILGKQAYEKKYNPQREPQVQISGPFEP